MPEAKVDERYYLASQWQLIWRSFRRHHLAVIGGVVLAALYFTAIFCEFFTPYDVEDVFLDTNHHPPSRVRVVHEGRLARPFVYGVTMTQDPETFQPLHLLGRAGGGVLTAPTCCRRERSRRAPTTARPRSPCPVRAGPRSIWTWPPALRPAASWTLGGTGGCDSRRWALDAEGRPTNAPAQSAFLHPAAGYKGYGLALIFECLSSLMVATRCNTTISGHAAARRGIQNSFVAAIDIAAFTDVEAFKRDSTGWQTP